VRWAVAPFLPGTHPAHGLPSQSNSQPVRDSKLPAVLCGAGLTGAKPRARVRPTAQQPVKPIVDTATRRPTGRESPPPGIRRARSPRAIAVCWGQCRRGDPMCASIPEGKGRVEHPFRGGFSPSNPRRRTIPGERTSNGQTKAAAGKSGVRILQSQAGGLTKARGLRIYLSEMGNAGPGSECCMELPLWTGVQLQRETHPDSGRKCRAPSKEMMGSNIWLIDSRRLRSSDRWVPI
jgi:hypothetical protein